MRTKWARLLAVGFLVAGMAEIAAAEDRPHRIGGGVNYWDSVEDLKHEGIQGLEDSGYSYYASYQFWPALLGFELQVEGAPDWIGQGAAYSPAAYVLIGGWLYGGVGIGWSYADGNWSSDPFYALKAGLNMELFPGLYLDISANYHVNSRTELEGVVDNIKTDAVFLGAGLRIGF